MAKFQKANVHLALGQKAQAAHDLEEINRFAPKEASVWFLLGKIYQDLGDQQKATSCFTTALDLDPKDKSMVKSALERMRVDRMQEISSQELFS